MGGLRIGVEAEAWQALVMGFALDFPQPLQLPRRISELSETGGRGEYEVTPEESV